MHDIEGKQHKQKEKSENRGTGKYTKITGVGVGETQGAVNYRSHGAVKYRSKRVKENTGQ